MKQKELIKKETSVKDICEIANDNAEGQVILSGKKTSIENFQKVLKGKKIKFIPLKVSAPFHCSLMKPAADYMSDKINNQLEYIYQERAYDTSSNELPSFSLENYNFKYKIDNNLKSNFKVSNNLDQDYEDNRNYNTPGISFFGGVESEF